jgi:SAM-dependent methyltransferase
MRERTPVQRFQELYAASADPWNYSSSEYEREKYAATLTAIGTGPYAQVLEIGCSIGIFTQLLAPRCSALVAMDYSPRALELATARVGSLANVELLQGTFPEQVPTRSWDLVVCSEVLYYLDRPALANALEWLRAQLAGGARVVTVSWRGPGASEPLRGDEVHDTLASKLASAHTLDARTAGYRLDRFDGDER